MSTGPCPRCARLISMSQHNGKLRIANSLDMMKYASRQLNGGKLLVVAAWGCSHGVPLEYWQSADIDLVRRLGTWGLFVYHEASSKYSLAIPKRKVQGWVASNLRPTAEGELDFTHNRRQRQNPADANAIAKQCLCTALHSFASVWPVLRKSPRKNLLFVCGLVNRSLTLLVVGTIGILPLLVEWNAAAPYFALFSVVWFFMPFSSLSSNYFGLPCTLVAVSRRPRYLATS